MARRRTIWTVSSLAFLALVFAFSFGRPSPSVAGPDGDRIALIYVEGVIMGNSASDNPFAGGGGATSVDIVQKLDEAQKDDEILAVVLRVNSPGGSAAASQEIYKAVTDCMKEKPVYISMGDVAASGGYYIAAPATRIFATPATLTGSIGVIMELPKYSELLKKVGIEFRTMKAGEHKDLGSPTRDITEEEKVIFQRLLTGTHDQFIKAVDVGRQNLDETQVRTLADGTIWTGEDAMGVGLVDELAGLKDVLDFAASNAQLNVDDYVVDEMKTSFFEELFGEELSFAETRSPFGRIGQLMMLQGLMAAGGPAAAIPQTGSGVQTFANSLFLCQPLSGGLGIGF